MKPQMFRCSARGCPARVRWTWCPEHAPRDLHDDHKPKPEGDKR